MTAPRRVVAVLVAATVALTACSSGGSDIDAFCEEVSDLIQIDTLNFDQSAADDPAIRSGLAQTATQFERVVRASPEEVRPSAEVLAGLTRALSDAVADSDVRDPFERSQRIIAAQQQFEERLPGAAERYNAYVAQHCAPAPGG